MTPAALAGMPMYVLTDLGELRFDALSFLVLLLLLAAGARVLWNTLARDVPRMPTLTYRRALAGVLLLSLAFYVVLAMISGARELMTPGAWERTGCR